ncbi:MAG: hypothetical protein WC777_04510 [Candidatus Gracilibacteria bacterium]|jgi:hypothetical protein
MKTIPFSWIKPGLILLILSFTLLSACASKDATTEKETTPDDSELREAAENFVLPEGPSLQNAPSMTKAPIYFFLFTHTEDHINHAYSEDRYFRVGEMIESLARENPETPINWTIEFQGADAATVASRNAQTGVMDYLLDLNEQGLVNFGYHAHHDPTYLNRPQKNLSADPSWDEVYDALHEWITCTKDPLKGGCTSPSGGGLQAILNNFGEVEIVTGLGIGEGMQIERSAGSQAVLAEIPDRLLAFGAPDHGGTLGKKGAENNFATLRDELMSLLSPTNETSSGTFWMDNSIRINDGAVADGMDSLNLMEGASSAVQAIQGLDRSKPHVINAGIASKYIYTKQGTSPTIWAYKNQQNPELPSQWLNSATTIEQNYRSTEEALTTMTEEFMPENPGSQWVSPDEVVDLFTSADYWEVDEEEMKNIALWILNEWGQEPPPYAYDGEDFYSLTDSFALLLNELQGGDQEETLVSKYYGPWSLLTAQSAAVTVDSADLEEWMEEWDFENKQMSESFTVGKEKLSPAQMLYALAMLFVNPYAESIEVPATNNAPETYGLLEEMGCTDCLDSAWSLKPARFQD